MKIRKLSDKQHKIIIFQGSPREIDTCADMESKTQKLVTYITNEWSLYFDIEVIDLSVNLSKKSIIQPCKGCISTAGGYHCHFDCSCYIKGSKKQPDLLKDLDVYKKLQECDAFLVFSPIHWFGLTSQVKTLFDRLVCINQTLDINEAKRLLNNDIKNHIKTGELSKSGEFDHLLKNHLEGKYAGFFVHGDDGANDYSDKELPDSYDIKDKFSKNPKLVVEPYVLQLKYSGVYVPDNLIEAIYINKNVDYYSNQDPKLLYNKANELMSNLNDILNKKD